MRQIFRLTLLGLAFALAGCLESIPKVGFNELQADSPNLRDRNATVAQAWDKASLDCRAQNKPRGSFCEQLKAEGEFLSCSADRFAESAKAFRYPATDKIWVWHNCVKTTANLLRDGVYFHKQEIERRIAACQERLDQEPEFPSRRSNWMTRLGLQTAESDQDSGQLVMPGDFGINQSQLALPNCAARFATQAPPVAEIRPITVVAPVQQVMTQTVTAPSEPLESNKTTPKQALKPKPRNAVSTADVKPTTGSGLARSGSSSSVNQSPEMKGACPIPGACGPSVPVDAVKRP